MAKSNRFETADIGPREMLRIANDPDITVSSTPFGTPPGQDSLHVKNAVGWKGAEEADLPAGVADGLQKAQSVSQQCAGEEGTTVYNGKEMPSKAVCQIERGG